MTHITMSQTAAEAVETVERLSAGEAICLPSLSRHLHGVQVLLEPENRTVWWVLPDGTEWAVETTRPGEALDRISELADPAWAAHSAASSDYHFIANLLLPAPPERCRGRGADAERALSRPQLRVCL
ncbi:hypothetical protein C9F11_21225 [Streptomyces sp. YIM 121038]|uniref:hypothetical protein n=1 Tax=Streptomyces sp. YIM 121038 TaxID=2136401 RepID=UPI001110C0EF|nr:hypothetical protein [Streptomyces sp. YIM 121038]QCX77877.1 hypothetical protein C9F11_21225 [Streptomyces sp. YIM 121038]